MVNGRTVTRSESYARYIWRQTYGEIPDGMTVDHIDGDRTNDAIENLQLLSALDNKRKAFVDDPDLSRRAAEGYREWRRRKALREAEHCENRLEQKVEQKVAVRNNVSSASH